jgi:hypothetical protein
MFFGNEIALKIKDAPIVELRNIVNPEKIPVNTTTSIDQARSIGFFYVFYDATLFITPDLCTLN